MNMPDNSEQDPPVKTGDDAAHGHSLPGRSFGLREAVIIAVLCCLVAITVAWLHR
ncbi:hypothetical protein [Sphingomonas sp.]|uniref:hypothetical protein n=1 Tax=Sphingomonas sp. TaxID=28214 RepID=UPI00286B37A8|nr:hypothetical protein [Sphingomonas sp.]